MQEYLELTRVPERSRGRQMNVQDAFLNQVRKERRRITMFLINGVKLGGVVRGFDSFVVVVEDRGLQQVVYKHAISTMIPATPVSLMGEGDLS